MNVQNEWKIPRECSLRRLFERNIFNFRASIVAFSPLWSFSVFLFLGWSGNWVRKHYTHHDTIANTHTHTQRNIRNWHDTEANKRCSWFYELRRGTFSTDHSNRPIANDVNIQDKMRWTDGHENNKYPSVPTQTLFVSLSIPRLCGLSFTVSICVSWSFIFASSNSLDCFMNEIRPLL